ncbi:NusA antitermination factor [Caldanaerobius fijiensis DSM 17918]|uniref:Transcription termination/antitermination protein NusA n=1 Tax=Caldanaerobius fijiensis DSM 17918 TaxID=1121256 RepID=A0A1M4WSR3_9THEO|nr:transcription termination factor NusA [Caldanaerobius fijiensis]SHE84276.1 NusA antitermination factor [Caldanaerobius fijiensis DSM 17918]
MDGELIEALNQIEKDKGVSKEIILEALETALITAYRKNYGTAQNAKVYINKETGAIKVMAQKVVVPEVHDEKMEISLEDAQKINSLYQLGDIVEVEITPKKFGRIAAQTAKQVVVQKIREAERGILYEDFLAKENDIIVGVVTRADKKNLLIDLGRMETTLPVSEQIPGESYKPGDRIKLYIVEVKKTTKGPVIIASRTHPGFVKRLFEQEVPEIYDGIVEIKSIAREAGSRTKMAVFSHDEKVDPVGACVGFKGARVQAVVNELRGEKIDIVKWSKDIGEFISNALSPANIVRVEINESEKAAKVFVPEYQLSLAIGKEGQNARLAAKLTGWKIDINGIETK